MKDCNMKEKIIEYARQHDQRGDGYAVFELLQAKWHARILLELCQKSPCRFTELKRAIPDISNTVLTTVLRRLEEKELIVRIQFNEHPIRVEYSLTERGEGMRPIFEAMLQWETHYTQIKP